MRSHCVSDVRWLVWVGAWVFSSPSEAACPASAASVDAHAQQALNAFANAREADFARAREELRVELGCLTESPSPTGAAAVHQVDALHWFFVKEKERSLQSFQAMLESDPQLRMDPAVAPPGGAVDLWRSEAALRSPSPREPMTLPRGYALTVDGAPATTVPTARPAIVVVLASDGRAVWSGMGPGALPELPSRAWTEPLVKPTLVGAGAIALASGTLWALALRDRAQLDALSEGITTNQTEAELGLSWEESHQLYRRTNALGYAAQATTGVAIGLGVLGLTWSW